jgi:hypothetical protein
MNDLHKLSLTHFSNLPSLCVASIEQKDDKAMKPSGLWVSVDGDNDWEEWCRSEGFWEGMKHRYKIKLVKDTNVLLIDNADDLRAFTKKYADTELSNRLGLSHQMHLRWNAIAQFYGGLIISPYLWECRYDDETFWYYGWDCASGCIWDHRCVQDVIYLGETHFKKE